MLGGHGANESHIAQDNGVGYLPLTDIVLIAVNEEVFFLPGKKPVLL